MWRSGAMARALNSPLRERGFDRVPPCQTLGKILIQFTQPYE